MTERTQKTKDKKVESKPKTKKNGTKSTNFLKSLPESMEHLEIVRQVAGGLEELQSRVKDVKEEASNELKRLIKRYETNYKGLEKKVHQATLEAKKHAQTSMIHLLQKWHEHKDKLPKPIAQEIEKILDRIGTRVVESQMARKPARKTKKTTVAPKSRTAAQKPSAKKKPKTVRAKETKQENGVL